MSAHVLPFEAFSSVIVSYNAFVFRAMAIKAYL